MSKRITRYVFPLLAIIVLFSSCKKEYEGIETIDDVKIQSYIKSNNLNAVKDSSGYYYQIFDQGTGSSIKNSDSIFYSYTFKTISGKILTKTNDLSNEAELLGYTDRFVINKVGYLLTPIREVLGKLNRGGKATIILPSSMAFGKNGIDVLGIPSNEIIICDVTLFTETAQWQIDDKMIKQFIADKGLTMIKHPSRVYYNVAQVGSGIYIDKFSTIKVKYTGRLTSGKIFDQTTGDDTMESPLASLILGWREVLLGFQKGTKLRMIIPSGLAYGTRDQADQITGEISIPKNSNLDFEIEIIDVIN